LSQLILASKSNYKRELLNQLNVPFLNIAPSFIEEEHKSEKTGIDLSEFLAYQKAQSILDVHRNSVIIACDQTIYLEKQRFDKPHTKEKAIAQLKQLQGKTHHLTSTYCILNKDNQILKSISATLKMRALTNDEIIRYIEIDKPFDCAGSYKLESLGISLFDSINTEDFTTITGLPLISISKDLRTLGFKIP